MALSKEITLTIKDYSITLSSAIKFYVNDCVDLVFILNRWGIDNDNGINKANPFDLTGITADLLVENPELNDTVEPTTINQNRIVFRFTNKYTRLTGNGRMQLRLKDDEYELKLPPFSYEIQKSINEMLDDRNEVMLVTEDGTALLAEDGYTLNLVKISELPEASKIEYSDYMIVNNNNETKKVLVSEIKCSEENLKRMEDIPGIKEDIDDVSSRLSSHTHSYDDLTDKPSVIEGENGATFTPYVSDDGDLSWTNDKGLTNPVTVNIKGEQGPKGEKGDKGDDGYTPVKGVDYFDGEKGEQGPKGEKGDKGDDGYTPVKGVDYFDGEKGDKGDDGYTPVKGVDYFDGEKGEQGPKGDDGYTPVKGVDYFDGEKGEQGPKGEKGDKGDDGYTPVKGVDYFDGEKGEQGPKGDDGLTTSISVNGNVYNHDNGTITLPDYPSVPTKVSQLSNDSMYVTEIKMDEAIDDVVTEVNGKLENKSDINHTHGMDDIISNKNLTILNIEEGQVIMTTDGNQYIDIGDNVNVNVILPSMSDYTKVLELHLYMRTGSQTSTISVEPSDYNVVRWQNAPVLGTECINEFIFTFVYGSWLAGCIVYAEQP